MSVVLKCDAALRAGRRSSPPTSCPPEPHCPNPRRTYRPTGTLPVKDGGRRPAQCNNDTPPSRSLVDSFLTKPNTNPSRMALLHWYKDDALTDENMLQNCI